MTVSQTGARNAVTCGNLPVAAGLRAHSAYTGFSCRCTAPPGPLVPPREPNANRGPADYESDRLPFAHMATGLRKQRAEYHPLIKFNRTNQDTCVNQRPV